MVLAISATEVLNLYLYMYKEITFSPRVSSIVYDIINK